MNHPESKECLALMQWARLIKMPNGKTISSALYHNPNGGHRNQHEAGRMKAEGVKAGIPDYHLPIPNDCHISLYIEMKKPDAVPSEVTAVQGDVAKMLLSHGNKVRFARNWTQAAAQICDHLDIAHTFVISPADADWEGGVWALINKRAAA